MTETYVKIQDKALRDKFAGKVYMDTTFDTAFKAFFDSENTLKDFLDGALYLEGEDKIKDISYTFDKTYNYPLPSGKKIVLDIFATTGTGRFLNVEMQRAEHEYFVDRVILYKSYLTIAGMIDKQKSTEFKDLPSDQREIHRYELPETVSIWICGFDLPELQGRYLDTWELYSNNSVEAGTPVPICPKNKYLMISLANFKKPQQEIHDSLDQWLYLLSHASDGTELPDFGNKAMEEALGRIRVAGADDEFLSSQVKDMEMEELCELRLASARVKAHEEARNEAREEAREEARKARNEALKFVASNLLKSGMPVQQVAVLSGLSLDDVRTLSDSLNKEHH